MLTTKFRKPERRRPKSQAFNRPVTSDSNEKKIYTEQRSYDLHHWVDFEDQIRRMAIKSFHSSIEPKAKVVRKQIPSQKEHLQVQFRELLKDVLQMNLRPDLYNKLSKFV